MADSYYMPFKDHSFDSVAYIATFEYYKDPERVLCEAARVGKYGIIMGMMNKNTNKFVRRRIQQAFGKNNYYVTAKFYTPQTLISLINKTFKTDTTASNGIVPACLNGSLFSSGTSLLEIFLHCI